ncbi:MAG: Rne/Rng family ribonuclease, partial [Clostridia bacterium]|nr:Rne/Rng family ribonuclease [Clostridia bacterium]
MKKLLIDYNPYCVRAALVENGELVEFGVEHATMRGLVGNIYKGKVENVLSGMKAAFVNIGLERNGFLYVGDSLVDSARLKNGREPIELNVSPGDTVMCQVVKDQFGTKGARLTLDVSIPGYFLVLLPKSNFFGVSRKIENDERRAYLEEFVKTLCPQNMGFIIRSAADKASDVDIENEAQSLLNEWKKVEQDYLKAPQKSIVFKEAELLERAIRDTYSEGVESVIVNDETLANELESKLGKGKVEFYKGDKNIFAHYKISAQVNRLADRRVNMGNGAYLIIDKTEALTVIDVNTGKFVGDKDLEDTVFKTNMVAAEEIAKQLRLRNISGIVVIDFIDMTVEEHKTEVIEHLKTALKKDRLKTSSVEMTSLGLVELTRKKTSLPVDDLML